MRTRRSFAIVASAISPLLPDGVLPDPAMHLAGALAGCACAMRLSRRARG